VFYSEFLCLCSLKKLDSKSFFVVVASLSGFGVGVTLASYNEFGSVPSLFISWKSLGSIGVSFSLQF
jgi:hypothetical protein